MLKNLRIRSKLVAIIAVPVVALVAFAAVGALHRRDAASSSSFDGRLINLVSADTALAQALELESSQAVLVGVTSAAQGTTNKDTASAAQLRRATDKAVTQLRRRASDLGADDLGSQASAALASMFDRTDALDSLRAEVDEGALPWPAVVDTYGQAVAAVLNAGHELVAVAKDPKVTVGLSEVVALAQVKADVTETGNLVTGVLAVGRWPSDATRTRFLTGATTEDVDLAIFKATADPQTTAALRNASSSSAVSFVDSTRQTIRDGELDRAVAQRQLWAPAVAEKVTKLHQIGTTLQARLAAQNASRHDDAVRAAQLYLLIALAAVLLALLIAGGVARSLARRMHRLTEAADRLSETELPRLVDALKNPDDDELARLTANLHPIDVSGTDEMGRLASSFNHVQRVAVQVAGEQASLLQRGIADTFVSLARRNQSLLDRQIEFIDQLESSEEDPDQLDDLFKLDHLATRMRRNAESLLVLAGAEPTRRHGAPVPVGTVVRAAVSEVQAFARLSVLSLDDVHLVRGASVDVTHLLAELMENATSFSPPETTVKVAGHRSNADGYVVSITDHGIGMSEAQLTEANELLTEPPAVGLSLARSLGLMVVSRLALRWGIRVRLLPSKSGGITAVVTLPGPLLMERPTTGGERPRAEQDAPEQGPLPAPSADGLGALDLDEVLAAERPGEVLEPIAAVAAGGELPHRMRATAAPEAGAGAHRAGEEPVREREEPALGELGRGAASGTDGAAPIRFGELPARRPRRSGAASTGETVARPAASRQELEADADTTRPHGVPAPKAPRRFNGAPVGPLPSRDVSRRSEPPAGATVAPSEGAAPSRRTPEGARSLLTSYRRGLARGRESLRGTGDSDGGEHR